MWTNLDWAPVAPSYDIYFGTNSSPYSGHLLESTNTSETRTFLNLAYSTTYYWQVVARNDYGSTRGPIWSFTTEPRPSGDSGWTEERYNNVSLSPREGIRYRLPVANGDTLIASVSPRSSSGDPDLFIKTSDGSSTLASSTRGAGYPDGARINIQSDGEVVLHIENISSTDSTVCDVAAQRIPRSSGSTSSVNGVYRVISLNGQSVPSSATEKWLFRDGRLVSRYVFLDLSAVGGAGTLEVWIDHQAGHTTRTTIDNSTISYTTTSNTGSSNGSSVSFRYEISEAITGVHNGGASGYSQFQGTVSQGGQRLVGAASGSVTMTLDGSTRVLPISAQAEFQRE